jgi:hypothetical protein
VKKRGRRRRERNKGKKNCCVLVLASIPLFDIILAILLDMLYTVGKARVCTTI